MPRFKCAQICNTPEEDMILFPQRIDSSVGHARVDNPFSNEPVMFTQTGTNPPDGFNGGGVGNKSILGFRNFDKLKLQLLSTVEWICKDLTSEIPIAPNGAQGIPYLNLIVDVNGDDTLYKIFISSYGLSPAQINNIQSTPLGADRFKYKVDYSTNYFNIVGGLPPVVPIVSIGPGTFSNAYRMQDVLASYPNARLRNINSGDGGLPRAMPTAGVILCSGDSVNVAQGAKLIESMKVNGVSV